MMKVSVGTRIIVVLTALIFSLCVKVSPAHAWVKGDRRWSKKTTPVQKPDQPSIGVKPTAPTLLEAVDRNDLVETARLIQAGANVKGARALAQLFKHSVNRSKRSSLMKSLRPFYPEGVDSIVTDYVFEEDYVARTRGKANDDQLPLTVSDYQYQLGMIYGHGKYLGPPNEVEALKWFELAAASGNLEAKKELAPRYFVQGLKYEAGDGIAKDEAKAVENFQKAALHGSVPAKIKLGIAIAEQIPEQED